MSVRSERVSNGFIHSVKVPKIYKTASSIFKKVVENGESLKHLVYSTRHKNIKGVYALVVETIKHERALDNLIRKSKLLKKEGRLDPWLARILLTEMIFRKKELKGTSKPVQTILSYRQKLNRFVKGSSKTVVQGMCARMQLKLKLSILYILLTQEIITSLPPRDDPKHK